MQHLSPEERKIANRLPNYPEDSAGRIMTAEYRFKASMTVVDALQHIRRKPAQGDHIHLFCHDRERRLKGVVDLRTSSLRSLRR